MNAFDHYKEAERLLSILQSPTHPERRYWTQDQFANTAAVAQVHAMLALVSDATVITYPKTRLTDEEAEELKARWEKHFGGKS